MDRRIPRKGDIYRHFKGKKYKILDIAVCTETGEEMVIFETMEGPRKVFASFLENFSGSLDSGKYPHADQKYRFELCRDSADNDLLGLKRHGNTTALILEFLDLNDNEERVQFLQRHRSEVDARFLTAASESLEFTENAETVEERYAALIRFLRTKSRYESRRLR